MLRAAALSLMLLAVAAIGPRALNAQIGHCHFCEYWWFDNPPGLCEVCFHYTFVGYQDCQQISCWECNDNYAPCPIWASVNEIAIMAREWIESGSRIHADVISDHLAGDLELISSLASADLGRLQASPGCAQRLRVEQVLRLGTEFKEELYAEHWSE